MSEQNDISEVQVGDKVVDSFSIVRTVASVSERFILIGGPDKYYRDNGHCVGSGGRYRIRPASADDIARHDKRQLSTWLNSVKWMDMSIKHLKRIKLAVEDHEGGNR